MMICLGAEPCVRRPGYRDEKRREEGLSEYFLFTIEGREEIKDKEPQRLVA